MEKATADLEVATFMGAGADRNVARGVGRAVLELG